MRPGSSNGVFFIFFPKPQEQQTCPPYLILILSNAVRLLLDGCNPWIATAFYICIPCQRPVSNYNPLRVQLFHEVIMRCHLSPCKLPCQSLPAAWPSPGGKTFPWSYNAFLENPCHFCAKTRSFLCHPHVRQNPETHPCLLEPCPLFLFLHTSVWFS